MTLWSAHLLVLWSAHLFLVQETLLVSNFAYTFQLVPLQSGRRGVYVLADLPSDPELLRRLRYVKEVLHQLVHRA